MIQNDFLGFLIPLLASILVSTNDSLISLNKIYLISLIIQFFVFVQIPNYIFNTNFIIFLMKIKNRLGVDSVYLYVFEFLIFPSDVTCTGVFTIFSHNKKLTYENCRQTAHHLEPPEWKIKNCKRNFQDFYILNQCTRRVPIGTE